MISGMQILTAIGITLLSAVPLTWFYLIYKKLSTTYRTQACDQFESVLSKLESPRGEYKYFSTGHPYTWTEISEDEVLDMVKWSTIGYRAPLPIPPQLLLHVNEEKRAVYIVTHQQQFDWNSLAHYEDYVRKINAQG